MKLKEYFFGTKTVIRIEKLERFVQRNKNSVNDYKNYLKGLENYKKRIKETKNISNLLSTGAIGLAFFEPISIGILVLSEYGRNFGSDSVKYLVRRREKGQKNLEENIIKNQLNSLEDEIHSDDYLYQEKKRYGHNGDCGEEWKNI